MQRFVIRFDLGFLSPRSFTSHSTDLNRIPSTWTPPPSLSLIHLIIVYGHVNVNVFTWRLIHSFYPPPFSTPIHSHQQFGRQLATVSTVKVGRNSFSFFFVRSFFFSFVQLGFVGLALLGRRMLANVIPRPKGFWLRFKKPLPVTVEFSGRQQ